MNLEQAQNNKEEAVKTRDQEVAEEADNYLAGLFSGGSDAVFKNILKKIDNGEGLESQKENIEFYWPGWGREDFIKLRDKIREKFASEEEVKRSVEIDEMADTIAKGFESTEVERARKKIFEKLDNGESLDSEKKNIALYFTGWKESDFEKLRAAIPQKMEEQKVANEAKQREIDEWVNNKNKINDVTNKIKGL